MCVYTVCVCTHYLLPTNRKSAQFSPDGESYCMGSSFLQLYATMTLLLSLVNAAICPNRAISRLLCERGPYMPSSFFLLCEPPLLSLHPQGNFVTSSSSNAVSSIGGPGREGTTVRSVGIRARTTSTSSVSAPSFSRSSPKSVHHLKGKEKLISNNFCNFCFLWSLSHLAAACSSLQLYAGLTLLLEIYI